MRGCKEDLSFDDISSRSVISPDGAQIPPLCHFHIQLKKTDLGFNPVKLKISKIFELRNTLLNARSIGSFIFTNDSPKVFLVLLEYGYIVQPTGGSTVMVHLIKYVCKILVCLL